MKHSESTNPRAPSLRSAKQSNQAWNSLANSFFFHILKISWIQAIMWTNDDLVSLAHHICVPGLDEPIYRDGKSQWSGHIFVACYMQAWYKIKMTFLSTQERCCHAAAWRWHRKRRNNLEPRFPHRLHCRARWSCPLSWNALPWRRLFIRYMARRVNHNACITNMVR